MHQLWSTQHARSNCSVGWRALGADCCCLPPAHPLPRAGTDLAQTLTIKDKIAHKKQGMPTDIAKSLARISSGLYIVTAANDTARSAMVASWVSQVCACGCGCGCVGEGEGACECVCAWVWI